MSERPTPETDDAQWGTGKVTTDFARRLERERDEAREALNEAHKYFKWIYLVADSQRKWNFRTLATEGLMKTGGAK